MAVARRRFTGAVTAFLAATLAATVGTLMHQTQIQTSVPIGLFFSLSLVLMLAAAIRDKFPGKLSPTIFTLALGIEIFVIGQNLTGDILIPGNNLGLWWSYGAIGVAALVALWPRLKS
jgi:hypothetical protein